jgi:hypothetical protein
MATGTECVYYNFFNRQPRLMTRPERSAAVRICLLVNWDGPIHPKSYIAISARQALLE